MSRFAMPALAYLAIVSFSVSKPAWSATAADTWCKGIRFSLPVTSEWSGSYQGHGDAMLAKYQQVLQEAMALFMLYIPADKTIFRWTQGEETLKNRSVKILLANGAGDLPWELPDRLKKMTAFVQPVIDRNRVDFYVVLRLDRLLFLEPGTIRANALGAVAEALVDSLFTWTPHFLARPTQTLLADNQRTPADKSVKEQLADMARNYLAISEPLLVGNARELAYENWLPLYWGTKERRALLLRLANPDADTHFAPMTQIHLGQATDALYEEMIKTTLAAAEIVGKYPPLGWHNNAFTWAANELRQKRVQELELYFFTVSSSGHAVMNENQMDLDLGFTAFHWGADPKRFPFSISIRHKGLVERLFLDDERRLRPDRLGRVIAFLARVYGETQTALVSEPRQYDSALGNKTLAKRQLLTYEPVISWIDRFLATPEGLVHAERATLERIRTERFQTWLLRQACN